MKRVTTLRQFPIDTYEAGWLELAAIDAGGSLDGYVAYGLFVGTGVVTEPNMPKATDKGSIDVFQPATEYWFTATSGSVVLGSGHSLQLSLTVADTRKHDPGEGWDEIIEAIKKSDGLANKSGALSPVLIGRAGPVAWSCNTSHLGLIDGLPTFGAELDRTVWALSIQQSAGGALTALYLSNDDTDRGYGQLPGLPEVWAQPASYSPQRIFIGYQAPPAT